MKNKAWNELGPLLGYSEDAKESRIDKCPRVNEMFWTRPEMIEVFRTDQG